MGVAVLEGSDLLYYGVKELRHHRPASSLNRATRETVASLAARFDPNVLAYEESVYVQQLSSALLRSVEREIQHAARSVGLPLVAYSPSEVRQSILGNPWATKHMIAARLAERFPELARYRTGQSVRSERYWLNMFDALAVAVAAVREFDGGAWPSGASGGVRAA
jgi:Holliday junction resolvasome RuvABC endonuclease subunit